MYLTGSGRGFLPLVSWDQAVTPVYIVLTAAYSIQGKEEECMIHIRGWSLSNPVDPEMLCASFYTRISCR